MLARISTFALLLILTACATNTKSIDPQMAQATLNAAWHQPQHIIWEIEGTTIPLGGTFTVESWRAGPRYRFEILQSPAPALVGEMLIVERANAWQYNRFTAPSPQPVATPWLSPMSDVVALIEQHLNQHPLTATERSLSVADGLVQEITLDFAEGDSLTMTIGEASGLPVRLRLVTAAATLELTARSVAPLVNPPAGLFQP